MLGDLTGFGYFDFVESHGYVRTATEVSSDNSVLMRNIRRHEVADASGLPGHIIPVLMLGLGYPNERAKAHPAHRQRKPIDEFVTEL